MGTKHGCCVDKSCTPETCMQLPTGTTCGDCANLSRCHGLFGCKPGNTSCDWFPRRFYAKPILQSNFAAEALDGIVEATKLNERIAELESSIAEKTAECERLRMVSTLAEGLRDAFEHVIAEAENIASGRRGMQVPFHGDFAAAVQLPSLVSTMRWWERELRAALETVE